MTVSVNLFGEKEAPVKAQVLGGTPTSVSPERFIHLTIGGLDVIVADANQAHRIAGELKRVAFELGGQDGEVVEGR